MVTRKILHIDMDAFFASVEQLDNPDLRGQPVIVGGDPAGRGVVAACSYEARAFGIHSAMSCARAHQLCRQAQFIRPRKERYREVSRKIMEVFRRYAEKIEPLSIDEAFLDVTRNIKQIPSATWTAQAIREEIYANTGLTASAGVSCNKFLAKVASDMNKPDGLTVITPEQALPFIRRLPIRKFYGVGRVTEQRMLGIGIKTGNDLLRYSRQELVNHFGKPGHFFYDIIRGIDHRPVCPRRARKSIGSEVTLKKDLQNREQMLSILARIADQVAEALTAKKLLARTLILKIRYENFITVTRCRTSGSLFTTQSDMMAHIPQLLAATEAGRKKVRLLGITVTNLHPQGKQSPRQLELPFPSFAREITNTEDIIFF
ncbi:MAG TPA: DNA polymerase IV [Desulfobulbus sp.]|nr:DNA polymerase IV [Desulfobulbus sp.]